MRLLIEQGPDGAWDEFVGSMAGDTYQQTSAHAEVKAATHQSFRVVATDGCRIAAGAQVLYRQVSLLGAVGYLPKGPLVPAGDQALALPVLREALAECGRRGIRVLVSQPVLHHDGVDAALSECGFGPSPVMVATTSTIEVALDRSADELLSGTRSSLRRNIRKAQRNGVVVRLGTYDDLDLFHEMHLETAGRNDFAPISRDRMEREWAVMHPRGQLHLFLTEHEGQALSGAMCSAFGDRVLFKHAGWFRSDASAAYRPNDLLHWEVIRWALHQGFAYYDLGGFDRAVAQALLAGEDAPEWFRSTFSQFKLGYGGTPVVLPRSQWALVPRALRPFQQPLRWSLETLPPARRALERRHNAA